MQTEWTILWIFVQDFCIRVMPFPQTRLKFCYNAEYYVALSIENMHVGAPGPFRLHLIAW